MSSSISPPNGMQDGLNWLIRTVHPGREARAGHSLRVPQRRISAVKTKYTLPGICLMMEEFGFMLYLKINFNLNIIRNAL